MVGDRNTSMPAKSSSRSADFFALSSKMNHILSSSVLSFPTPTFTSKSSNSVLCSRRCVSLAYILEQQTKLPPEFLFVGDEGVHSLNPVVDQPLDSLPLQLVLTSLRHLLAQDEVLLLLFRVEHDADGSLRYGHCHIVQFALVRVLDIASLLLVEDELVHAVLPLVGITEPVLPHIP